MLQSDNQPVKYPFSTETSKLPENEKTSIKVIHISGLKTHIKLSKNSMVLMSGGNLLFFLGSVFPVNEPEIILSFLDASVMLFNSLIFFILLIFILRMSIKALVLSSILVIFSTFHFFISIEPLSILTLFICLNSSIYPLYAASGLSRYQKYETKVISELAAKGVFEPDEKVIYFSTETIIPIMEEGNILTNKGLISYTTNEDEIIWNLVKFHEIKNVRMVLEDTCSTIQILEIIKSDGESFDITLTTDLKQDKLFIKELTKRALNTEEELQWAI